MVKIATPGVVPRASALRQWAGQQLGTGQSASLITMALEVAATASDFVWYCDSLKQRRLRFTATSADADRWERWWRDRRMLWRALMNSALKRYTGGRRPIAVVQYVRQCLAGWNRMPIARKTSFLLACGTLVLTSGAAGRLLAGIVQSEEVAMENSLANAYFGLDEGNDHQPADRLPFMFLLTVDLPCWLAFGVTHDVLYRRAVIGGDFEALVRLVRLDPFSRQLPGVGERINGLILSGQSDRVAQLEEECLRPAVPPFDNLQTSVKAMFISWLVDWSRDSTREHGMGRGWQIPQLADLFHAMARDRGRGSDKDLWNQADTLRKMVTRYRKRLSAEYWDIFRAADVTMV